MWGSFWCSMLLWPLHWKSWRKPRRGHPRTRTPESRKNHRWVSPHLDKSGLLLVGLNLLEPVIWLEQCSLLVQSLWGSFGHSSQGDASPASFFSTVTTNDLVSSVFFSPTSTTLLARCFCFTWLPWPLLAPEFSSQLSMAEVSRRPALASQCWPGSRPLLQRHSPVSCPHRPVLFPGRLHPKAFSSFCFFGASLP